MEILKNIQKHLRDLRDEKFVVKLNTEVRQQTNSDDCGAFGEWLKFQNIKFMVI